MSRKEIPKNSYVAPPKSRVAIILHQGWEVNAGCMQKVTDPFAAQMVEIVSDHRFFISKYLVTQSQWWTIMGERPSHFGGCDDCPVESVSWEEVQGFLYELQVSTGQLYRLPTAAEWEYAALGGTDYRFAGSDAIETVAWYAQNSRDKTHPVGQKSPNGYGLYDMSGNVWEWCSDLYAAPAQRRNNKKTHRQAERVVRGGSWGNGAEECRVATIGSLKPDVRYFACGFRLAQ